MGPLKRQCAALALAAILLCACGEKAAPLGELGAVQGFLGGAVAEEPRAALVARDALSSGGTAADAAVAAFFTLSVTYASGAGLGASGVCVVYDAKTNKAETLEFLPQPPTKAGGYAIPGAVRGMALLHARYGRLQWSQLTAPAEALARFGFPASRALATRIAENQRKLAGDPQLRAAYLRPDGAPKREGESVALPALSAMLSQLRSRGAGDLYGGQAGKALAEGAGFSLDQLRGYRANWRPTENRRAGNLTLHAAFPPPRGGPLALDLIQGIPVRGLAAIQETLGQLTPEQIAAAGEAGFATADRDGSAVACTVGMGAPFGAGRSAGGAILASASAPQADFPAPLVAVNHNIDQTYLAAAASGGWTGPIELAKTAIAVLDGQTLDAALAEAAREPAPGRVHALWCAEGFRRKPERCEFRADPRGHGLGVGGS